MAPPKTPGWRSAYLAEERRWARASRTQAVAPPATTCEARIQARRTRVLAAMGPKVANAVKRLPARRTPVVARKYSFNLSHHSSHCIRPFISLSPHLIVAPSHRRSISSSLHLIVIPSHRRSISSSFHLIVAPSHRHSISSSLHLSVTSAHVSTSILSPLLNLHYTVPSSSPSSHSTFTSPGSTSLPCQSTVRRYLIVDAVVLPCSLSHQHRVSWLT